MSLTDWVTLNVGGTCFSTTRATLCLDSSSVLAAVFSPSPPSSPSPAKLQLVQDEKGHYLLDRHPGYFGPVLSFLRSGRNAIHVDKSVSLQGVLDEARALQVGPLVSLLEAKIAAAESVALQPVLYLVVQSVTLYHAGRARVDISFRGPLSSRKREALLGVGLDGSLNMLASWGWRVIASCGKGGDHEKYVCVAHASDRKVDRYISTIIDPIHTRMPDPMALLRSQVDAPVDSDTEADPAEEAGFDTHTEHTTECSSHGDPSDDSDPASDSSSSSSSSSSDSDDFGSNVPLDIEGSAADDDDSENLAAASAPDEDAGGDRAQAALGKAIQRARKARRKRLSRAAIVSLDEIFRPDDEWISLNVGGSIFTTTLRTLRTRAPDSMLAQMFRAPTAAPGSSASGSSSFTVAPPPEDARGGESAFAWNSTRDASGAYLVDRDPLYFGAVLHYLRTGSLVVDPGVSLEGIRDEAAFFAIEPLLKMVDARLKAPKAKTLYQYLIVRSMTLYYARRAQTKISIKGPYDRFTNAQLDLLSLAQVFNIIASDGWRLITAAGKGGDQEKFIFERAFTEAELAQMNPNRYVRDPSALPTHLVAPQILANPAFADEGGPVEPHLSSDDDEH